MLAKCAGLVLLAALATATTKDAVSTWANSTDYCSPGLCSFGVPCVTRACRRPTIRGGAYALNGSVPGDPGGALPSGWCPSDESCADLRWLRAGRGKTRPLWEERLVLVLAPLAKNPFAPCEVAAVPTEDAGAALVSGNWWQTAHCHACTVSCALRAAEASRAPVLTRACRVSTACRMPHKARCGGRCMQPGVPDRSLVHVLSSPMSHLWSSPCHALFPTPRRQAPSAGSDMLI